MSRLLHSTVNRTVISYPSFLEMSSLHICSPRSILILGLFVHTSTTTRRLLVVLCNCGVPLAAITISNPWDNNLGVSSASGALSVPAVIGRGGEYLFSMPCRLPVLNPQPVFKQGFGIVPVVASIGEASPPHGNRPAAARKAIPYSSTPIYRKLTNLLRRHRRRKKHGSPGQRT